MAQQTYHFNYQLTYDEAYTTFRRLAFRWSKVKTADGYRIWSFDPKTGKYTKLATVKAPQTSVTLKTNARQFVIRAYQKEAGDVSWSAVKTFS